jgi:Mannosyl-glycoprotein endo-beta-N-acetylglucosaminidase
MGSRVNRVKTSASEPQMAQAIIQAWRELFGTVPSKAQVSLILAQNNLETGNRVSMYNNNIGNITTNGKDAFNFYDDITTDEQVKPGVWEKKNLKYRSYPSLKDGVKDYLNFLSGKNYSAAWQNILHPNPIGFSKALKDAGYYTANEKPYTDTLNKIYSKVRNSNSYELAMNNKVTPPLRYVVPTPSISGDGSGGGIIHHIEDLISNFLRQVAAMDKSNNKLYKKYLPRHNAVISVIADDQNNAFEFARLLSLALSEELSAKTSIHSDNGVEVDCTIFGPEKECFAALEQLTNVLADSFKENTRKLGGIIIKANIFTNKTSSYQLTDVSKLEIEHRKFLLKIAQG